MKKIFYRVIFIISIILIWEITYILKIFPELLFPSIRTIIVSFIDGIVNGQHLIMTMNTIILIFKGLALGTIIALILMGISLINKFTYSIVDNMVLIMNPIPGIVIFPLVILWFGLGTNAMIVILIHSVLWGFLLNLMAGISSIPKIYTEIGLNLELSKYRMFKDIYLPASITFFIPGLKAALARAWRSAIAVELLAGVMANNAGLGWLMNHQRSTLDISGLFSTIIIIIIIGIFFEEVAFGVLERLTIKKWGMGQ
jgi:NitT/TauT family transport system permease protein